MYIHTYSCLHKNAKITGITGIFSFLFALSLSTSRIYCIQLIIHEGNREREGEKERKIFTLRHSTTLFFRTHHGPSTQVNCLAYLRIIAVPTDLSFLLFCASLYVLLRSVPLITSVVLIDGKLAHFFSCCVYIPSVSYTHLTLPTTPYV